VIEKKNRLMVREILVSKCNHSAPRTKTISREPAPPMVIGRLAAMRKRGIERYRTQNGAPPARPSARPWPRGPGTVAHQERSTLVRQRQVQVWQEFLKQSKAVTPDRRDEYHIQVANPCPERV
jgi:hypothetical protein